MVDKSSFKIKIGGDTKEFNKKIAGIKRSLGKFKRSLTSIQGVAAGLGVSLSAAFLTREAIKASDTYKLLEGRLRLVTKSEEELRDVEQQLFNAAQDTRSEYEGTVNLYTRVARNAETLGLSQKKLLDLTVATNQAIKIGGSTSTEASAGVIQFAQALASGELRGDEFRSVMENMPRLAQALADGLDTDIGKLREMSKQGKLTADVVTQALLSQVSVIENEFQQLPVTIGQSFTQLNNDFQRSLSKADLTGFNDAIGKLRDLVKDPEFAAGMLSLAEGVATLARLAAAGTVEIVGFTNFLIASASAAGATGMGKTYDILTVAIRQYTGELDQLIKLQESAGATGIPLTEEEEKRTEKQIATIKKHIEFLKEKRKLSITGGPVDLTGNDLEEGSQVNPHEGLTFTPVDIDTKAFEKALAQIQRQLIKTQELTEAEKVLWETQNGRYKDLTEDQKEALIAAAAEVDAARASVDAEDARSAAAQQLRDEMEAAAEAVKNMVDPTRELNAQLVEQQALLDEGLITWAEWARAQMLVNIQIEELGTTTGETAEEMSQFSIQAARSMQSAFADFLFDPFESSLSDMFNSFKDTIRRMAAEIVAQEALSALFPDFSGGSTSASVPHAGGIVGGAGRRRSMPLSAFVAAPRFHRGGLASNEVPAVLERGEEVLTADDPRHRNNLGGGSVTVELVNNGTPQQVDSSNASFDVTGTIVRIFTDDLRRGGPIDTALTSTGRGRKV